MNRSEDLLCEANMSPLELGRVRNIAKEVFQILNGLSHMYLHDLVSLKKSNYTYFFRYQNLVDLPRVSSGSSTTYGKRSFRYEQHMSGTASQTK